MAGRIVVVRNKAWAMLWPRWAVRIDGQRVGKLPIDSWRAFEVDPGVHGVRVSQAGYSSRTAVVSVADHETVVLRSRPRFGILYLNNVSGVIIGISGITLFDKGPTPDRVIVFVLALAVPIMMFAARLAIRLRPDPAPPTTFERAEPLPSQ